jgi:hypothetical protein
VRQTAVDVVPPRRLPGWALTWLVGGALLASSRARADSERLVLGTHDAALAAALSVAVSPRGLSVVELPEPLGGAGDPTARRELLVPGTVAVVWLCDDAAAHHSLCFLGGDGSVAVKPVSVVPPLAPPDAAALALSVKMLLGAPPARPAPPPESGRAPGTAPAPAPPPGAVPATVPPPRGPPPPVEEPPFLAIEVGVGARVQSPAAEHVGLRVAVRGVLTPGRFAHALGAGIGLDGGPALAASAPAGRTINDSAIELFARGRVALAPAWLELDAGPSLHFVSVAAGPTGSSRTELGLDARAGVMVPVGRTLLGVRAGGFYVVTSPAMGGATPPVALPRWNGEALLTVGFAVK